MFDLNTIKECIISGNLSQAEELTQSALEAGVTAKEILDGSLVPALDEVGKKFQAGVYFFPELLVAGEATRVAMERLKPELSRSGAPTMGKYAIGTVKGDIHDIGKNIVIMMLEGNGWEVTDLGTDVSTEKFCEVVKEGDYKILGLSALLTTTIPRLAETMDALKEGGLREKVKVMVGGVSINQEYADQIGADAYGKDAFEAVIKARALAGKS